MQTVSQLAKATATACGTIGKAYGKLTINLQHAIMRAVEDNDAQALNAVLNVIADNIDAPHVVRGAAMYMAQATGCTIDKVNCTITGDPELAKGFEFGKDEIVIGTQTAKWYNVEDVAKRIAHKARQANAAQRKPSTPRERVGKLAKSVAKDDPILAKVLERVALSSTADLAAMLGETVAAMPEPVAVDVAKSA